MNMRPSLTTRMAVVLIGIGGLVAMCSYAVAKADPAQDQAHDEALTCRLIDQSPNEKQVGVIIKGMMMKGWSAEQVGTTLGYAARDMCPEYKALISLTLTDFEKTNDIDAVINGGTTPVPQPVSPPQDKMERAV